MLKSEKKEKTDFGDLEKFYNEQPNGLKSQIDRQSSPFWRRLLIIAVGLFAVASLLGWLGFYVFGVFEAEQNGKLDLAIEAPEKSIIAEPLSYRVVLKNNSTDTLQDIKLDLNYPDGFVFGEASLTPTGSHQNFWEIAKLDPLASREILVTGRLLGEMGNVKTIYGEVKYNLPNIRSGLQTSVSATTALEAAKITLDWQGTTDVRPGDKADYTLNYLYEGTVPLGGTRLAIILPTNFSVTASEPSVADLKNIVYDLPELKTGDKGSLKISGTWSSGSDSPAIISGRLQTSLVSGVIVSLASKDLEPQVIGADVSVRLRINGSDQPPILNLGQTMNLALVVENASDKIVSDMDVALLVDSNLVDWSRAQLPDGGQIREQSISWQSSNTPQLVSLSANSKITLTLSLPIKLVPPAGATASTISLAPHLAYNKLGDEVVNKKFDGAIVQIEVSSPLNLQVEARYFSPDGSTEGTGPLPPVAGVATRYRLIWRLGGAVHRLTNATIEGVMPAGVILVGPAATPAFGSFTYSNNKPVWKLPVIEAGVQPSLEMIIELTPDDSDVGKILVLSGQTQVTATDDVTGGQVRATGSVATTNLDGDAIARGKGVVVAP